MSVAFLMVVEGKNHQTPSLAAENAKLAKKIGPLGLSPFESSAVFVVRLPQRDN